MNAARRFYTLFATLLLFVYSTVCKDKSSSYCNLLGTGISMMGLTRLPGVARYSRLAGFIYFGEHYGEFSEM